MAITQAIIISNQQKHHVFLFIFNLFSSMKLENRRADGGLGTSGGGRCQGRGRRMNMVQTMYTHMYVNAKMVSAETVPGIKGGMGESSGGGKLKNGIFNTL
jgi:hypothetical protein